MHPFYLRRTTIQPRLFQQACRLASTRRRIVKPRPGLEQQSLPQRRQDKDDDEEVTIRWFEKDVETGAIRRVSGNPEEIERRELRQKIKALEAELSEYKSEISDGALMAALEPQERKQVERALQERKSKEQVLTSGLEVSLDLPPLTVPLLKRLNTSLCDAALNPDSVQRRKELWRWYCRGKHNIPALPRMIPARAWQVLWETQSVEAPTNPDRLQHINQILEDMISVAHPLTEEQRLVYIDTLVHLERFELALQRWHDEYENRGASHRILEVGISLFKKIGDLDRAHLLLQEYLTRYPTRDPRIILTLITANVKNGNDDLAFALYLQLRSKLGSEMTMDDYDVIALQFLNKDKKDLALAVFRDMMLQGSENIRRGFFNQKKQEEMYKAVFNRIHVLRSSSSNVTEVNNVSLAAMSALPHQWQNKYFYGSWMKKMIGLGQLDAASKIVELMYERGVAPDTKHINGLLGAFLRSDDPTLQERGLSLGWSMIQQRLDFTWRRRERNRHGPRSVVTSVRDNEEGIVIPPHVARPVPRASIETFNVLVLYYIVKQSWGHVKHLHRMLRPAEISMDSFFMNHLLQMELYFKDQQSAWRLFVKTARTVPPDMETYNCLWTAELRHIDRHKTQDHSGFPLPRQLFSVMLTWLSSMDEKHTAIAREAFSVEIYGKIVKSFCDEKDFVGCLVAVHALAQHFGHYPDHDIARIVTTAVSNLPESHMPQIRGRRGRQQLPVSQARLKKTAAVLSALANRRAQNAMEHGIDMEKLTPEERAEESMNLLSEFIRVVLVRSSGKPDAVEQSIEHAAQEMGVPGIRTGDKDASNVV